MGQSDFLFARPSFLEGMARSLDLFGVLQEYNRCRNGEEADAWAMYEDFAAVSRDMKLAAIESPSR
jgi:hypothetical protein